MNQSLFLKLEDFNKLEKIEIVYTDINRLQVNVYNPSLNLFLVLIFCFYLTAE